MDIAYALRTERDEKQSGGLYDWSQVEFSYNSNHMEGSTITRDQTAQIYSTGNYVADKDQLIRADDQIESKNHFKLFDYMLDTIDQPLTVAYLAKLQGILKAGTSDEQNPNKVVGGFKRFNNVIGNTLQGDVKTADANEVEQDLTQLLRKWQSLPKKRLADYAEFHYEFERIHPFSDGNGRIGRILLFKERCKNRQMPFIIRDENRPFYIRGLQQFTKEPRYLIDTLGQSDREPRYLINTFEQSIDYYKTTFKQIYGERLIKDVRAAFEAKVKHYLETMNDN